MINSKRICLSALLIAIGTLTSHIIFIPVGVSKCFPVQHLINVLSAVTLGPGYALWNAFAISTLRNILGTGTPLAFPGSMIGAFLAGYVYEKTNKTLYAVGGELVGTGLLGALLAYPVTKYLMGKEAALFFFVLPFMLSSLGGSIAAYIFLKKLKAAEFFQEWIRKDKKH